MLRTNLDAWRTALYVGLGLTATACGGAAQDATAGPGANEDTPEPPLVGDPADAPIILAEQLRCTVESPYSDNPPLMQCANGIVHRPPPPPEPECVQCPVVGPLFNTSSDECVSDADCAAGTLCITSVGLTRMDSTCEGVTIEGQTFVATSPYFACQAAEDECGADSQCRAGQICAAWPGGRRCEVYSFGCGVPGRPFLVADEARVAGVRHGMDWSGPLLDAPLELDPSARASLARYWLTAGLREHASIAAFCRFTLQLMSVAAPHELCLASQRAMADETEHTRRCFALASRYAGSTLGPDALSMDGAVEAESLASIARLTFREGCLGETCAALEAAEALASATDPEVCTTLELIARDERQHAELAWRFVAWALERDATGEVRSVLRHELEQLRAGAGLGAAAPGSARSLASGAAASDGTSAEAPVLARHGHMSERECRAISRAALADVVLPCMERLLARDAAPASRVLKRTHASV